jgi:hypothetical protein
MKRPRHSQASGGGEQSEQCMSVMPGLEATAPMGQLCEAEHVSAR